MEPVILLAEDSNDDLLIFTRALKRAQITHTLVAVDTGQEVIDYLAGEGRYGDRNAYPLPSLILLDLKMPLKNGFDVLEWLMDTESLRDIPAVVLSSSDEPRDIERALQLGARTYLVKPPTAEMLLDVCNSLIGTQPPQDTGSTQRRFS